jgi:hypothetical protein
MSVDLLAGVGIGIARLRGKDAGGPCDLIRSAP